MPYRPIKGERPKPRTAERRRKPGRPPVVVDPGQLHALATIHCTMEEAAHVLGIAPQTLHDKIKTQPALSDAWDRGQAHGKTSLRRALFAAALGTGVRKETRTLADGKTRVVTETNGIANVTAQIWLSKQHLGMKDVQVVEHDGGGVTLFDLLVEGAGAKLIGSSSDEAAANDVPPPIDKGH